MTEPPVDSDSSQRQPFDRPLGAGLVIVCLALLGIYQTIQVQPLGDRLAALERAQVISNDGILLELQALRSQLDHLARRVDRSGRREATVTRHAPVGPASTPTPAVKATVDATPLENPHRNASAVLRFLEANLFPKDAEIAWSLYAGLPVAETARRVGQSTSYVLIRAAQIERDLKARPKTPREILERLHEAIASAETR